MAHESSVLPESPHTTVKTTSSVHDAFEAPSFGSRYLTDEQDVFSQNAWDHVSQPSDWDTRVVEALERQRKDPVPDADKPTYNDRPSRHWDLFYKHNADNFFRDRKWLHLEFPELVAATQESAGSVTVMEVGCGAGNAIFPLLSANKNPHLKIIACDYAPRAVQLVKSHELYRAPPAGSIMASLWDLTSDILPEGVAPNSVDIVVMIFVLSALHPDEWHQAVTNVHKVLKPGGRVVLRDYGRYDLTQLRFKERRLLGENFYIRGDKTRVYFFSLGDLSIIFTGSSISEVAETSATEKVDSEISGDATPSQHNDSSSGSSQAVELESVLNQVIASTGILTVDRDIPLSSQLQGSLSKDSTPPTSSSSLSISSVNQIAKDLSPAVRHPLFSIHQLGVDNRLIVNRRRQLKMHRVWMQGQFIKLVQESENL